MNGVVHWVKAFVTKPDDLSLIPEISTVEQENQLPQAGFSRYPHK